MEEFFDLSSQYWYPLISWYNDLDPLYQHGVLFLLVFGPVFIAYLIFFRMAD